MPARPNRTKAARRGGGRVTPKGTRPTAVENGGGPSRRPSPVVDRTEFGHDPNRGARRPDVRPVAPRAGTRGNR